MVGGEKRLTPCLCCAVIDFNRFLFQIKQVSNSFFSGGDWTAVILVSILFCKFCSLWVYRVQDCLREFLGRCELAVNFFFFCMFIKISEGRGLLFVHSASFESFRYRVCLSIETAQRRKFCVHICFGWVGRQCDQGTWVEPLFNCRARLLPKQT